MVFEKWRFYVFFIFFSKNLDIKKLTELQFLNPIVRCCQDKFRSCKSGVQVWLLKSFNFSRYGVFIFFFLVFFFKKLRYKKTNRTWISQPYSGLLSEYSQGLQIWRPSMTAQIFLVFEKFRFLWLFLFFFKKIFRCKKLRYKKLTELEFLNLIVGCCQGAFRGCKSGVQVWLLKSFNFSRYGVFIFFFLVFFFKKLRYKKLTELEFLNIILGCCQGNIRGGKSGL